MADGMETCKQNKRVHLMILGTFSKIVPSQDISPRKMKGSINYFWSFRQLKNPKIWKVERNTRPSKKHYILFCLLLKNLLFHYTLLSTALSLSDIIKIISCNFGQVLACLHITENNQPIRYILFLGCLEDYLLKLIIWLSFDSFRGYQWWNNPRFWFHINSRKI